MSLNCCTYKATCIFWGKVTWVYPRLLPKLKVGICNLKAHMHPTCCFVNKVIQTGSVVTYSSLLFSCYKPHRPQYSLWTGLLLDCSLLLRGWFWVSELLVPDSGGSMKLCKKEACTPLGARLLSLFSISCYFSFWVRQLRVQHQFLLTQGKYKQLTHQWLWMWLLDREETLQSSRNWILWRHFDLRVLSMHFIAQENRLDRKLSAIENLVLLTQVNVV